MKATRYLAGLCVILTLAMLLKVPAAAQGNGQVTTIGTQGGNPEAIAVNPVTNFIYVANYNTANVSAINGADNSITLIPVDANPRSIGVNTATNKIYVADFGANLVTVIKASQNNQTISVSTGRGPYALAVNPVTNLIYVANDYDGTVTVINGVNDTVVGNPIRVANAPCAVAINQVTNKIYVANCNSNSVTVIDAAHNNTTVTIATGANPQGLAINTITNKIYVANANSQFITVIDGASNNTTTVTTGNGPRQVAVNPITNHIFATNWNSASVSVINGADNSPITDIAVGVNPYAVAVNAVTGLVYVANYAYNSSTVSVIDDNANDGGNLTVIQTISVGREPVAISVNPVTDRIYIANSNDNTFSVIYYTDSYALQFVPVAPCRLVDTRSNGGPIPGGSFRDFNVPSLGGCNIPSTAAAFSLNVTALPQGNLGYLSLWPTGEDQPLVSTLNSPDGRVKANAAIVPAGYLGDVSVYMSNTSNVILDIDGYFTAPGAQTYQFYPVTPCRIVDTRNGNGGPLQRGVERDYTIAGNCGIPSTAAAYSFNVTVLPTNGSLDYLTVWPQGQPQPTVSTLNDPTGTAVANAAIVPAGSNNATAFYAHNNPTNLLVDVNGYFAPADTGGLSLYPMQPCRVLDTRQFGQPFQGQWNPPNGVNVLTSPCAPPASAGAFVFNATVVPPGPMGYLTLWPHGEGQPTVSTLNAGDGFITSNMAIVPTNDGSIDAYASGLTQLILDISSYFAP